MSQFPQFANLESEVMGQGWDNLCVLYENSTVFRFPTRAMGGKLIARELAALPFLRGQVPLPIPHFELVGCANEDYPYDFVGYRALPGLTSDQLEWTPEARRRAIEPLASFLRSLHGLTIPENLHEALPKTRHDECNLEWLMERIRMRGAEVLAALPNRHGWVDQLMALAENLRNGAKGEPGLVICHGDLYPRHILADESLHVTGVIDWGDVHLGHPGADLSLAYTFFEREEREEFWRIYEHPVSEEGRSFAQLKAILYAFALSAYGTEIGDEAIAKLGDRIGLNLT